ncbi:TetR/AcrR family transcriptional regulator [Streptomyces phaeofaciens JCM 4814]|uniref:TetR family transcriptional regulator n=1 Tax=Streptomyces phaeofaciens TaxID=68254 RepID=A0A918LRY0_9ACTN|nr:TetR/AcrR family transcriptional regulator [Streptomyces phaeofaciens]GGT44714.1 TetR family transcriptional regulator [Streptomyces phaeofaciens]
MIHVHIADAPGRGRTRLTRARILEAARRELGRDPDSSLGDIAEAAGVVRRTVYGHFNGRAALVSGLVEDAAQALRQALAVPEHPASDAVTALARFVLAAWPVGDRYRMLLRLAPQDLGAERVGEVLAPARRTAEAIIDRGQRQGVFQADVPPGPLSMALEGHLLGLLECVNAGTWTDDGTRTATAALIAMGVDRDLATACVRSAARAERIGARAPDAHLEQPSPSTSRREPPWTSSSGPMTNASANPATPTPPCT